MPRLAVVYYRHPVSQRLHAQLMAPHSDPQGVRLGWAGEMGCRLHRRDMQAVVKHGRCAGAGDSEFMSAAPWAVSERASAQSTHASGSDSRACRRPPAMGIPGPARCSRSTGTADQGERSRGERRQSCGAGLCVSGRQTTHFSQGVRVTQTLAIRCIDGERQSPIDTIRARLWEPGRLVAGIPNGFEAIEFQATPSSVGGARSEHFGGGPNTSGRRS